MARKAAGAKQMPDTATPTKKAQRTGMAVRLEIPPKDHDRLSRLAAIRGLSLSSYARMALFKLMWDDEKEVGAGK
jgi:hypothetical protein